jgi:[protein-PII] uridylyltransferase
MAPKRTCNSSAPLDRHSRWMMRASFPLDPTSAFRASMPERYRQAFDDGAIREHAAIVGRRRARSAQEDERADGRQGAQGSGAAHLEIWRQLPKGVAVLCVVADDRPGLLSFICAALVLNKMDVLSAQAYTRLLPEGGEAVDFLWLRRDAEADHAMPALEADVERISDVLRQLTTGELSIETAAERARSNRTIPPGASTTVTFDEDDDEGLVVLTVETFDRPGLLLAITLALFRARVQIITSDAVTRDGRVFDRFSIVELDGTPIRRARRGLVQIEVLEAIHALSRR